MVSWKALLKLNWQYFTNFWLININFNDIETPNAIGEADDLEATFNLGNMELDNEDNIDTSILILNDNEGLARDARVSLWEN